MSNPFAHKDPQEWNEMWQVRALRAADGKLMRVMVCQFMNEYIGVTATSWTRLFRFIYPGFVEFKLPQFIRHARVELSGRVTCIAVDTDRQPKRMAAYQNKDQFISDMRRLADKLKLADLDRVEMFAVLGKWIAADLRVGAEGEKLAS